MNIGQLQFHEAGACTTAGAFPIAVRWRMGAAALLMCVATHDASAQSAPRTPAVIGAQMAAEGDSSGAIAYLQEVVARDKRDASAWNTLGKIAWARTRSEGRKEMMPPDIVRLRSVADSALRYATELAPDSARFWYDLAKYSLNTGNVFVRTGAAGFIDRGITAAEQRGDSALWSRMVDEQGMTAWRAYHAVAHRALRGSVPDYVPDFSQQKNSATSGTAMLGDQRPPGAVPIEVRRDKWAPYFREFLQPLNPPAGLNDFTKATDRFRRALEIDPKNRLARQHLLMSLVEQSRWRELHTAANNAIRIDSAFVEGWLARGLAAVRLNDTPDAVIAFESASRIMPPAQLLSFTDFRRMLPPHSTGRPSLFPDSVQYAQSTPELRERWETLFWGLNDPRALTPVNEARLEHFARIAHADLLWSSDDFDLRGRDSDRGDVLIRYGPPDHIYSHDATTGAVPGTSTTSGDGTHVLIWVYENGLAFVFGMTTGYGTAFTAVRDRIAVDSIREEVPVSWDNMKAVQRTSPMLSRAARFRATADSMDVIIATAVPVRSLLQNSELGGALPIDVQLDVHDPQARIVGRQVQRASVPGDNLPVGIDAWWVRRLGRGLNVVRVDAEQKDVERAAVSTVQVTVVDSSGFGVSDILFSTSQAPSGSAAPRRWSDLQLKPNVGLFPNAQPIGLVWENYNLANENGNARYRVTIQLERTFTNNLRGFGARVMANLRNVAQGSARGTGSLSMTYDETRPHGDAIVDFLSISLTESVPGPYRVTITILDLVSGTTAKRTADFRLFQ